MTRRMRWAGVLAACLMVSAVSAAGPIESAGKVDAVTVYRGQALVTRGVELPGPAGLREVIVTDLPDHVVPGSIYAESADGVEVRSVLYRVRPVAQDVREEVRQLDEQIRQIQDKLQENQRRTELAGQQRAYLDKLEQFVAPTANVEMTQGVLNAETVQKLTEFLYQHRKDIAEEDLRLGFEKRDLTEQVELLQRQRKELTGSSARTAREAVVFVNLQHADGGRLRLRYIVNNANWSPSYNVRTDADRSQVIVEANASIQQMSGEDWTDVAMTLSTATPSLVAKAPVLSPMSISLASPVQQPAQQAEAPAGYKEARRQILERQSKASSARNTFVLQSEVQQQLSNNAAEFVQGLLGSNDAELNRLAGELQNLDLTSQARIARGGSGRAQPDEDVTVTYQLAGRTSLPSRSDRQLIQIAAIPMKGEFYKVAIPVLTGFVYEEAALSNQGSMVLLAGPVATYVAGEFVGHGEIPTVAVGEGFTVGFGIDSTLRARRELVEKTETIQGGNRVVGFTYRLVIENFGTEPVTVRLFDRLPQPQRSDIKLSLVSTGEDLSEDDAYRQGDHKKGVLRWEIDVPAQAMGMKAKAIEYQFRLEYDKQMTIAGLAAATN